MSKLTELANSRPCSIRGPDCNPDPRTTVAAHFRSQRIGAGMGIKPPDIFIAFACNHCHDWVDGRKQITGFTREEARQAHMLGVMETQKFLFDNGHIRIGK